MLLESMIDHEYALTMKMEVEAPMVIPLVSSFWCLSARLLSG